MFRGFISKEKMGNCTEILVSNCQGSFLFSIFDPYNSRGRQNFSHYPGEETRLSREKLWGRRFWAGKTHGSPKAEASAISEGHPWQGHGAASLQPRGWGSKAPFAEVVPSSHVRTVQDHNPFSPTLHHLMQGRWCWAAPSSLSLRLGFPPRQIWKTPSPSPTLLWAVL